MFNAIIKKLVTKLLSHCFSKEEAMGLLSNHLSEDDVQWVVNNLGELGVKIGDRYFFLYKGQSLEYHKGELQENDDGSKAFYLVRRVGKREFGETCTPRNWDGQGEYRLELREGTMPLTKDDKWHRL